MVEIPESVQKVIEDYVNSLAEQITIKKVILFGSYAKGSMHDYSDIDLAIFSNFFKDMSRVDGIRFLVLKAMDYDIDIEPQAFTVDDYEKPMGIVEEIIKTGIEIPV